MKPDAANARQSGFKMNNFNKALIAETGLIMSSVTTALLNENEDEIREQIVLLKLLVEDLEMLKVDSPTRTPAGGFS